MNTEADYEVRLTDRVRQWEARHPTEAAELRLVTQRKIGMLEVPPPGSIRWLVLEMAFRDEVRKLHPKWPTLDQFIRDSK